jgi:hypothetical protein
MMNGAAISMVSKKQTKSAPSTTSAETISIDKVNLLQMDKLNNSVDVLQKPTLNGTLNGTSLKYLMYLLNVCHI